MDPSRAPEAPIRGQRLRVSAPGKVLLTGGYLVLEERFTGLVLATSARFYTSIGRRRRAESAEEDAVSGDDALLLRVCVESPQFNQTVKAAVTRVGGDGVQLHGSQSSDRNAYVEETLLCAFNGVMGVDAVSFLQLCSEMRANGEELHIRLEADNAFYSQVARLQQSGKRLCRQSLEELPAFLPPLVEANESGKPSIAKTGLGSSAALVTSLVGAIAQFFLGHQTDSKGGSTTEPLDLIHNLAQLSHCFVQRKIGSGFDVSAASFGSQRYSRFPPTLLDVFTSPANLTPAAIAVCIRDQAKWSRSERVKPFSVPAGFYLLMGDVSTGSATVSMVKQVLKWRKENPKDSVRVISALAAHNEAVDASFQHIHELKAADELAFEEVCRELALVPAESVHKSVGGNLTQLRSQYQNVRRCFREMGELAGVPIEPPEQTALIDATMSIPGVLIAGVPGAGGYDALFVLTLDVSTLDRVEKLWLQWTETHPDAIICPLLCDVARSSSRALTIEVL